MKRLLIAVLLTGCAGSAPGVTTDPRPERTIQPGSSVLTTLSWVRDNAQRFDFGETGMPEFEASRHWDGVRYDDGGAVDTHGIVDGWYVDTENYGRIFILVGYTYSTDRRWHVGSVMTTYDETPPRDYICGGGAGEEC